MIILFAVLVSFLQTLVVAIVNDCMYLVQKSNLIKITFAHSLHRMFGLIIFTYIII